MKKLVLEYELEKDTVRNYKGFILKIDRQIKILLVENYSFKTYELIPENLIFHFHRNEIDFFRFLDLISKNPISLEDIIKFIAFNVDRQNFKESVENITKSLEVFDETFLSRFFRTEMKGIKITSPNLIENIRQWCIENNINFLEFMKKRFKFEEEEFNNYFKGILKKLRGNFR